MTELTETQGDELEINQEKQMIFDPTKYELEGEVVKNGLANGPDLLERASKLNKLSEVSQVALGMCLAIIKEQEAYKPDFPTFEDYYRFELGRSKGDISKLLRVGHFMIKGQFPEETQVPYTKLYQAIICLPDSPPEQILAVAQTNTLAEIADTGREEKFGEHPHDWENAHHCKTCGKYERV